MTDDNRPDETPPWQPPPGPAAPPPGPGWMGSSGQWQAPSYPPQPQWSQAGYWGPAQPAQPGSSTLAVVAAVILLVASVLVGLIGLMLLVLGVGGAEFLEEIDPTLPFSGSALASIIIVTSVIMIIFSIAGVTAAIGAFMHKAWARWTGIVVAVIGLLFGVLMLLGSFEGPVTAGDLVIVVVWLAAYGFAVYGLTAGGAHFAPRQQER